MKRGFVDRSIWNYLRNNNWWKGVVQFHKSSNASVEVPPPFKIRGDLMDGLMQFAQDVPFIWPKLIEIDRIIPAQTCGIGIGE